MKMTNDINTLDQVLEKLPPPPKEVQHRVIALPIAHLTSVRSFDEILECVAFKPQHCNVFQRDLLYFSYGGIFHRYGAEPTEEATKIPVAFVFKPTLLKKIDYLFPYDTGAANKGLYLDQELCNFDKYRVSNDGGYELPPKLVYYVYNSNEQYLQGEVVEEFNQQNNSLMEPMLKLLNFLQSNLCPSGVDYRQRVIECQSTQQISLAEVLQDILWVGFPTSIKQQFYRMCELNGKPTYIPKHYSYNYVKARRPSEITSILENEARKMVYDDYLNHGKL
jgi:hypothetical protein